MGAQPGPVQIWGISIVRSFRVSDNMLRAQLCIVWALKDRARAVSVAATVYWIFERLDVGFAVWP